MDVHSATISLSVLDSTGKLVPKAILEPKACSLHETSEVRSCAAWWYDLVKP